MNLFVNPALKNKTIYITSDIYDYARANFGRKKELKAWSEFIGMDPDEYEENRLFMSVFIPWYLYTWRDGDNGPIAYDYLEDHADELSEPQKHFIMSLVDTPYSFYQMQEVVAGHYLRMKDLITKETLLVFEQKASQMLRPGDIIFTKVASIDELNFLVGSGPIIIQENQIKQIHAFARNKAEKDDEFCRILLYYTMIATTKCCECNGPVV